MYLEFYTLDLTLQYEYNVYTVSMCTILYIKHSKLYIYLLFKSRRHVRESLATNVKNNREENIHTELFHFFANLFSITLQYCIKLIKN